LEGDLVKSNNDQSVEFLKMDIEGSEHKTLIPFLREFRVCQIFLEIHGPATSHTKLLNEIALLNYALFWHEPNSFTTSCCEYSFIHLDCIKRYGVPLMNLIPEVLTLLLLKFFVRINIS
uniref:Methyltransf_21 domain-containing protein n=1 Tax=Heligmosomoides polygyrus TaxID=6339 RepID=A0A183FVF9_HELPZ